MLRVFHLDDDLVILDRFKYLFKKFSHICNQKFELTSLSEEAAYLKEIQSKRPDIVLIDVHLEGNTPSGVDLAQKTRAALPESTILMVSGSKDFKIIRSCLQSGADDFISKDVEAEELLTRIEATVEQHLRLRNVASKIASDDSSPKQEPCIGATMANIKNRTASLVSSAVNCIYIEGESGTGKEVVASLIAEALPKNVPFVRLNCGSISPNLIASELFGHTKGSFTGATSDKQGLIESANGGWIFLDEVATLPSDAQVALLRAIDNQSIRRIGSTTERPLQFRVISATNEPLEQLVDKGTFRRDLWQRLRETQINLPPLRARKSEIGPLIDYFLKTMRGGPYRLAPTVRETLATYDWVEGNVRELRNALRAMTENAVSGLLTPKSIPERIWAAIESGPARPNKKNETTHSNQLTISWQGQRPDFDHLALILFAEILRFEHASQGHLTIRSLAKALGMAKSTVATRIGQLQDSGIMSETEMNVMIKPSSKDKET
jgi:DNA-binding NtrC family response regulator